MRQIVVSTTTTGVSDPVVLDTYIAPFQVSLGIAMSSGSEVAVQHTYDNVLDSTITPVWYPTTSSAADEGYLLQEDGFEILQENGDALLTGDENFSHFIDFPVADGLLNTFTNAGRVTMIVLQCWIPR